MYKPSGVVKLTKGSMIVNTKKGSQHNTNTPMTMLKVLVALLSFLDDTFILISDPTCFIIGPVLICLACFLATVKMCMYIPTITVPGRKKAINEASTPQSLLNINTHKPVQSMAATKSSAPIMFNSENTRPKAKKIGIDQLMSRKTSMTGMVIFVT